MQSAIQSGRRGWTHPLESGSKQNVIELVMEPVVFEESSREIRFDFPSRRGFGSTRTWMRPSKPLGDRLHECARLEPDIDAYVFLSGGKPRARLTYEALHQRAAAIANGLHARGVRRGDRVLLLHSPGLEFVEAFFGPEVESALPFVAVPAETALPLGRWHPPYRHRRCRHEISDRSLGVVAKTYRWGFPRRATSLKA